MNELGSSPKKRCDNGKADRSFPKAAQERNLLWYKSLALTANFKKHQIVKLALTQNDK